MAVRRKRILKQLTINAIAAVDRPAQEHARAVLMKRAGDAPPLVLLKRQDDEQEHIMQIQKIDNDEVASFDTLDEAVAAIEKVEGCPRSEAMSRARERRPDLVKRYNDQGVEIAKRAADAARPRPVAKAVQDFEDRVDEIAKRDGCPRSDAMEKAARENPRLLEQYQTA